jgi:hypothetical protein
MKEHMPLFASDEEIRLARETYSNVEGVSIDDNGERSETADGRVWVQAWVLLPDIDK